MNFPTTMVMYMARVALEHVLILVSTDERKEREPIKTFKF